MAKLERMREVLSRPLTAERLAERTSGGWRAVAVEWQREVEGEPEPAGLDTNVPYGLRVADDGQHLAEDPSEKQVLISMMELIIQDLPLSRVAEELNRRSLRTRRGQEWSPVEVFQMLPRLIEVGPRIFSSDEWVACRRSLLRYD